MIGKFSTGKTGSFFFIAIAGLLSTAACRKDIRQQPGTSTAATRSALAAGSALSFSSAAQFNTPFAVAVDVSGNVYVADAGNHSIRKMTPQGVVSTLAGNGSPGFVNGAGTAAQFNFPTGLVVDRQKNVYVADANNNCIRMIDVNGNVTTLAGDTARGYVDGVGTVARFMTPEGITMDGNGNLYVADTYNSAIRRITRTGIVTTVAGGVAGYQDGTGTGAKFLFPVGVVSDAHGNLFVADRGNYRVRTVSSAGVTSTIAGDGSSTTLGAMGGISLDPSGIVLVSDEYNNRVLGINSAGIVFPIAGAGTIGLKDGPAAGAQFYYPMGLASDGFGALYVADTYNHRVVKVPRDRLVYIMAGNGSAGFSDGPGLAAAPGYNSPYGVFRDAAGNTYVNDENNRRVRKINTDGLITTLAGNEQSGNPWLFNALTGIVADAQGNVYVADQGNNVIDMITPTGAVSIFAGDSRYVTWQDGQGVLANFSCPTGLAIDGQGNIYVADRTNSRIRKITTPGAVVTTLAGDGSFAFRDGVGSNAEFCSPVGVAVDSQSNVYVADTYNSRIRKISPLGAVTTVAGDGNFAYKDGSGSNAEFNLPTDVVVDATGNVYVADQGNNRIRKINSAGTVTTLAGDGTKAYKDATGLAAEFANPTSISFDVKGNLYIADQSNNRIRKITATGVVTTF